MVFPFLWTCSYSVMEDCDSLSRYAYAKFVAIGPPTEMKVSKVTSAASTDRSTAVFASLAPYMSVRSNLESDLTH